ncbi:hypothetical protein JGH11_15365 [Dysgonomonas sp. Marseille-P4677]|nr:hypothetical protein [Dysgonomonas sp. Marseille-P4677]MBK5722254.1 hypothetical protein [Dysgonomonas sp. Marseille-P4677]
MKKIVLSAMAGIIAGYFFRKIQDKAFFEQMSNNINGFSFRRKKKK